MNLTKIKMTIVLLCSMALMNNTTKAQVKIGQNETTIEPSSILELESTVSGLLLPRLTSAQRDAISSAPTFDSAQSHGLLIYNTDHGCINFFDNTHVKKWVNPCRTNNSTYPDTGDVSDPEVGDVILNGDCNCLWTYTGDYWIPVGSVSTDSVHVDHDWYNYASKDIPMDINNNIWTTGSISFGNTDGKTSSGKTIASSSNSMAGGTNNSTSGDNSGVLGEGNNNTGENSFALGVGNTLNSRSSLILGDSNFVVAGSVGSIVGGKNNKITGNYPDYGFSVVFGHDNLITGGESHLVMGIKDTVGECYHIIAGGGSNYVADNVNNSFVIGQQNRLLQKTTGTAPGNTAGSSANWGIFNTNYGHSSAVWGERNTNSSTAAGVWGYDNNVSGNYAFAAGEGNTVSGRNSGVWGKDNNLAGEGSFTTGLSNSLAASGNYSIAIGRSNTISSPYSACFGQANSVNISTSGTTRGWSVAMGYGNTITGAMSLAAGFDNSISSDYSFAMGRGNTVVGRSSSVISGENITASVANTAYGRNARFLGNVTAATWTTSSDFRLKTNIVNSLKGLNKIMELRPVEYDKKESLSSSEYKYHELGFIAQEVQEVLPQIVNASDDGTGNEIYTVNYTELIPVLTKAIQELNTELVEVKAELDASNAKNAELKAELTAKSSDIELIKAALLSNGIEIKAAQK